MSDQSESSDCAIIDIVAHVILISDLKLISLASMEIGPRKYDS